MGVNGPSGVLMISVLCRVRWSGEGRREKCVAPATDTAACNTSENLKTSGPRLTLFRTTVVVYMRENGYMPLIPTFWCDDVTVYLAIKYS